MARPTVERRGPVWLAAALVAVLASGCLETVDGVAFAGFEDTTRQGIRTLSVLSGAARVRAPDGYCIDQRASRAETGFVVMAACGIVSDVAQMPSVLGLVTVQVGAPGSAVVAGSGQELADFLKTSEGSAMLAGGTNPDEIAVRSADLRDALVVEVIFADAGAPPVAGLGSKDWRAFFDIRGRLVTLSARGYDHTPLRDEQGLGLLRASVRSVIGAN